MVVDLTLTGDLQPAIGHLQVSFGVGKRADSLKGNVLTLTAGLPAGPVARGAVGARRHVLGRTPLPQTVAEPSGVHRVGVADSNGS